MPLHKSQDDYTSAVFSEFEFGEDREVLSHRRHIRKLIEDKLEFKRLKNACKDEWDELNDDFDWENQDNL